MIEVVNRQRKVRIDPERWRPFSEKALTAIRRAADDATIAFVSDRQIKELNRRFRGIAKATDVLSFPAGEETTAPNANLGDIAISLERAADQAKENKLTLDDEIAQLILHGLLHLCGYDHETDNGEMNRLERKLRAKLKI
ncbi:MAG TPA: rRNA maturation RNase YbeY [Pyrinomonadaceae bacterium]|nr:rRNA maturation RNase YbeY [Pyrinomonadaceae bacterium]